MEKNAKKICIVWLTPTATVKTYQHEHTRAGKGQSFKYLGVILTKDGSYISEICIKIVREAGCMG